LSDWQALWAGRERFVIFDTDYGDGAPFGAALAAFRADPLRPAHLHYIALDRAAPMPGFRRVPAYGDEVTLDLLGAPIDAALAQLRARFDLACLRGMGSQGVQFARALGRLAAPGMRLACEALSGAQLRALEAASFRVDPVSGQGVYISRRPLLASAREPERRAIVLGAGLAGSAACQRLVARGWQVTLVERHAHPAVEASGNLAGIMMPLLSRDDNHMTRLSRAAFQYAQAYWETLGGVGAAIVGARCGVLQLARDAAHAQVQRTIAATQQLPPAYARWLDADEASSLLKGAAPHGAWLFPQGGWVRPASACGTMLTACGARLTRRFGVGSVDLRRSSAGWVVLDSAGAAVAEAPVVVLASGAAAGLLPQAAALPLSAVRGQVTHLAAGSVAELPFVLCREAYLTPASPGQGLHSAGATYDETDDPSLRQDSQHSNLLRLRDMLGDPDAARDAPLAGRVGFRSVAPDRLPLIGALPDPQASNRMERLRDVPRHPGLYGLLGYASRGLTWAPLAAELLAAQLDGAPLPLESELVDALDPARFMLRERRRNTR
jgi:tRNA 5-methylaminomethyl-2-thiouridine biosynthesis bifunctional protein